MSPITLSVIEAKSLKQKSLGLIGTNKPRNMLFKTRFGIHTLGMNYPIDVIVLDKHHKIVKAKPSLYPNSIFIWPIQYDTIIELPEGSIKEQSLHHGSTVSLVIE